ncbi:4-diphosphocytidyl-2-C-methyl-D-erythritol kinase [Corynebacterium kalinowskii]|uniref:4-diphosphocytidyl-2-C-methyl-D-erythritol kinase n=1 Tax=Corynebacterium kalinowskii TaxID=2675216 RepID=A0A6B8VEB0_9CORY|nr:4-(cytidine 5'-diphospho)-2-C-methyl-D-erythritol kinase [Corynebacterium kalinowskii]QGU02513.1 4-diphosphocytidyl-2-C-methyl-D-erythritol kinase [Corynebacterium kalinowskii]
MTILTARAHAKVNLHLGVGDAREDGYHELVTVFQSLSLHDDLEVELLDQSTAEGSIVRSLSVTGLGAPAVPTTPDNLVWKAIDMATELHRSQGGAPLPMIDIRLRKGIPTAGGMAGGSADAAAALRVMGQMASISTADLLPLAARLGSDVPFTLLGGTMLGTGRGEQLVPLLSRGTYHWALALNSAGLSTPKVFHTLDDMRAARPDMARAGDIKELSAALLSGDPHEVAKYLANDLQAPALSLLPQLRRTLNAGETAGALAGVVSGSGPTVAFLCESAEQAVDVADYVLDTGVATSVAVAEGPAGGAELVG